MSEVIEYDLPVTESGETMELKLVRMPNSGGIPVLLLHGASANLNTFLNPVSSDPDDPRCLADWLWKWGYEPWLLDWRGNGRIEVEALKRLRSQLDFDHAARLDIPAALERIEQVSGASEIAAVGHCMGAASLAQAIAGGHLKEHPKLKRVVLMAIGLFYEPAMDGRLKSQDFALERLWAESEDNVAIDPRPEKTWPKDFDEFYRNWPVSLRSHENPHSDMEEVCNKVSFMFGQPYRERQLDAAVHESRFLEEQFGAIPLRMYLQGARNVRRGWAAEFGAANSDASLIGEPALQSFTALERVTLLTGAKNNIWHRESIDRMYEWLRRSRIGRDKSHRKVFQEYAHQDLLWGRNAYKEIFPAIKEGLPAPDGSDGTRRRTGTSRSNPDDS